MLVPFDHPSPEKGGSAETPAIDKEMPYIGKVIDGPTLFKHVFLRQPPEQGLLPIFYYVICWIVYISNARSEGAPGYSSAFIKTEIKS
jgi:hypothetical protein